MKTGLSLLLLLSLAGALGAGEAPSRAEREAKALAAISALPEGDKRDAGLKIVRSACRQFRDDSLAAAAAPPADATPERLARLAELAERNRSLATLSRLRTEGVLTAGNVAAHLARWPLDDEAHLLLGRILFDHQDGAGAQRELRTAEALDPACTSGEGAGRELRGRLGLLAAAAETDPTGKLSLLASAALDLAPTVAGLLNAGVAAEVAGEVAVAGRILAELERLAPAVGGEAASIRLDVLRACALERAGEAAKALALWDRAVAAGVTAPDPAPHRRALIHQLEAARVAPAIAAHDIDALRRLSPAFPAEDALQDRLFRLLLSRGRLGDALAAARELLAADPRHPLAQLILDGASAGLDPKRVELLPPFIGLLRSVTPTLGARFSVLYALDATMCEVAGDPAAAATALGPLLAAQPGDREVRAQRARLHLAAGDPAAAITDLDILLAAGETPDLLALRGRARAAAGDRAGALADADRLVGLSPGPAALLGRARVRRSLDDRAGALADCAAITAAAAGVADLEALLAGAELAAELGDEAAHRAALERAAALGSADASQRLRRLRR